MADETTTSEATTETTTEAATTTDKPAKGGKTEAASTSSTSASSSDYDWRGAIAGEDKKLAKRLERFTDLTQFGKSYFEADAKLNDGKRVMIPGADATDEDRAAWIKQRGIPETPDKYEIKVKPPEGLELSEGEQDRLKAITARLHKAGGLSADPEVVNLAHEIYYQERMEAESQMMAQATIQKEETEAFLKKIWPGQELKRNVAFADQAISHYFKEDFAAIKDLQFADGTRLGDNLQFIQAMARIGRDTMEDPVFLEAGRNGADPGKSLDKELESIMSLRATNRAKYNAPETQKRLAEIYAAKARHDERSSGAN